MKPSSWSSRLARLGALAAILSPLAGRAQMGPASAPPVRLPAVEVVTTPVAGLPTAGLFAESVTSVSADQLRDLDALDVASALRRTPGLTITRYNQVGSFGGGEGGAIFVRGLGLSRPGGEIKTTVDGVPKGNGVFNHPLLDLMSIDVAERIDVQARATPLDVGNTFAAVNIVTPRMTKVGRLARTQLAAGNFGTLIERVEAGAKDGAFDCYLVQSYRRSDGHRPDSSGSLQNCFARAGWAFAPHWEASYTVQHTRNFATDPGVDFPLSGVASTRGEIYKTADWLHTATLAHHSPGSEGSFRVYRNDGEGDWTRRAYSRNADGLSDWRSQGVRWREMLHPWPDGEIVAGADMDETRGTSRSVPLAPATEKVFGPESMRLFSAYAGANHTLVLDRVLKLTPSFGARFYDQNVFGRRWAPQAGLVLAAGRTQWRAGWNRALNYPGLDVAAISSAIANPALGTSWRALRPEQVGQSELGVRYTLGARSAVAFTLFRNDAHDRYVIVPPPPPPPRYANVGAYRTEGAELSLETSPRPELALFAAASTLNTTPGDLPYAPRRTLTGGLNWRFASGWMAGMDGSYSSAMHVLSEARSAGTTNPIMVGSRLLLNARISRRFAWDAHRGEVYVSAENLMDRRYSYRLGYPMPGINGMLGVRLDW